MRKLDGLVKGISRMAQENHKITSMPTILLAELVCKTTNLLQLPKKAPTFLKTNERKATCYRTAPYAYQNNDY